MRVLYLHQYFTTPSVSGGTRSYELARRLVKSGHQVTMITSAAALAPAWAPTPGWHRHNVDDITVDVLHVPYSNKMSYPQRIRAFFEFALKGAWHARSQQADVILATSTPLTIAIPGIIAAKSLHVPMVFEVRDLWPEAPIEVGALRGWLPIALARWLERMAYAHSARIVALSPGIREGIARTGYPLEHISLIPNGCDLELFQVPEESGKAFRRQLDWLQDRPLVVYTGTLGLVNQVEYLAYLAAEMRTLDPDVRFLIIGDGKQKPVVRAQARALNVLDENFFMLPPVPKQEIVNVLSAATVATSVFAPYRSMWSNSANKFFDALAAGRPVAINYRGWQAELLQETGAGIVLPETDCAAAARSLAALIHDPQRLRQAREAAYRLAVERFSRDALAQQLEAILVEGVCTKPHT